jgi:hypothetical protein
LTRGPIQLAFTGPATLVAGGSGGDPRVLFNCDGVPHAVTLPPAANLQAPPAKGEKTAEAKTPERLALGDAVTSPPTRPPAQPAERAGSPGCAEAGGSLFCVDRAGAVHRSGLAGEGSTKVAQAHDHGRLRRPRRRDAGDALGGR